MEFKRFFSSLIVIGVLSCATTSTARLIGGYEPIADPRDPFLVGIGKFAVREHNKEAKTNLVFLNVLSAERQVVAGINYKVNIQAKSPNSNHVDVYQTGVYVSPSQSARTTILTSFSKLEKKN